MLIYGAVIIPVIAIILLLCFFKQKIHPAEYALQLFAPILIIFGVHCTAEYSMTSDVEYLGGWATSCTHEEAYNKYIHRTCTRTVSSGKKTRTETYDCSYVSYHPEKFWLENSNKDIFYISQADYSLAVGRFGNEKKTGHHIGHTISGDIFSTFFPGNDSQLLKTTNTHNYTNRVQASHNVMNFPDINKKEAIELGLFEYPPCDLLDTPPILGHGATLREHRVMDILNSRLGAAKQIHIWVLLFSDKSSSVVQDQINYWKNGNKNELICCVGLKNGIVQWSNVFTWSESDLLRIRIRDKLAEQIGSNLNLISFAEWVKPQILSDWKRKEFKDFNYLTVDPPFSIIIATYIITILASVGLGYFNITNDLNENDSLKDCAQSRSYLKHRKKFL